MELLGGDSRLVAKEKLCVLSSAGVKLRLRSSTKSLVKKYSLGLFFNFYARWEANGRVLSYLSDQSIPVPSCPAALYHKKQTLVP